MPRTVTKKKSPPKFAFKGGSRIVLFRLDRSDSDKFFEVHDGSEEHVRPISKILQDEKGQVIGVGSCGEKAIVARNPVEIRALIDFLTACLP